MIELNRDEIKLLIDSIRSRCAILDWDNYNSEEYESPKAEESYLFHLLNKLIKELGDE